MTSELMKRFLVRAHQPSAGAAPSRLPIAWRLSAAPAPRGKRRTGALPQQSLVQARIFTGRAWKPIARLSRDLRARELNCVRVAGDLLRDASWDSLRRPGSPWAASVTFFKTRTRETIFILISPNTRQHSPHLRPQDLTCSQQCPTIDIYGLELARWLTNALVGSSFKRPAQPPPTPAPSRGASAR